MQHLLAVWCFCVSVCNSVLSSDESNDKSSDQSGEQSDVLSSDKCGVDRNMTSQRFPWDVRLGYRKRGRLGWTCSGGYLALSRVG